MIRGRSAAWILGGLAQAALAAGCAHPEAKVAIEVPRLVVPPAPPRVIETAEVDIPPAPEEVPPALPSAGTRPAASPPPRSPRAAVEPTRQEPTAEAPKAEEAPRAVPSPPLQTMPPQQERSEEVRVRAAIGAAEKSLSRVDYRALGSAERTQYDQARNFIKEAEEALKAKQVVFARSLADKAATIAAQLAGR